MLCLKLRSLVLWVTEVEATNHEAVTSKPTLLLPPPLTSPSGHNNKPKGMQANLSCEITQCTHSIFWPLSVALHTGEEVAGTWQTARMSVVWFPVVTTGDGLLQLLHVQYQYCNLEQPPTPISSFLLQQASVVEVIVSLLMSCHAKLSWAFGPRYYIGQDEYQMEPSLGTTWAVCELWVHEFPSGVVVSSDSPPKCRCS